MTDERIFGIDISFHQGDMDWSVVASNPVPVRFVYIRAGISWGFQDSKFRVNWDGAKEYEIPRGSYSVLYPDQPIERQVDNLLSMFPDGVYDGELPPALDLELTREQSYSVIGPAALSWLQICEAKTGRRPIIYSRANWMNDNVTGKKWGIWNKPPAWLDTYDYWLAQYLKSGAEHPGPPDLPKGVSMASAIIHQTADHTPSIGGSARDMDYNRWLKSEAEFEVFAQTSPEEPPPDPVEPPGDECDLSGVVEKLMGIKASLEEVSDDIGELINELD